MKKGTKKYIVGLCVFGICAGVLIWSNRIEKPAVPDEKPEIDLRSQSTWEDKIPEPAKSKLRNQEECWLCGNSNRSLMGYFRKFDDVGIICVNNWYVLDMKIRNHDEEGNFIGPQEGSRSAMTGTGEGGCFFSSDQNSDRGISRVTASFGEDSIFDVSKVQRNLCQECLDKLLEVMETYGEESEPATPRDLCLVDFQTLELYPLQKHNIAYFIRDYYICIDTEEDEVQVQAFYAPVLENGE